MLNSNLITWYHHKRNPKSQKALFPKILVSDLKKLPLPDIDYVDLKNNSSFLELVENMLDLNKQLINCKTLNEKRLLEKQIEVTDNKINQLVYELYGLTDEEISIVEASLK